MPGTDGLGSATVGRFPVPDTVTVRVAEELAFILSELNCADTPKLPTASVKPTGVGDGNSRTSTATGEVVMRCSRCSITEPRSPMNSSSRLPGPCIDDSTITIAVTSMRSTSSLPLFCGNRR